MSKLSLENKTVEHWFRELKEQAVFFICKIQNVQKDPNHNTQTIAFYKHSRDLYLQIADLLRHLIKFDRISDPACPLCKKNCPEHFKKLNYTFKTYRKLILTCRDGYRFKNL